ncbi:ABC transporter substrate-binding protein, partial [Acinetobacter baumannii]
PLIDEAFNLSVMAQLTVGSTWAGVSASERNSIIEALSRYMAARHAHEFADFTGERINVETQAVTRGSDKLVRATVIEKGAPTEKLGYRLRE